MRRMLGAAVLAGLVLAGCGSDDGGDNQADEAEETTTTEAEPVGLTVEIVATSGDIALQLSDDDPECRFADDSQVEVRSAEGTILGVADLLPGTTTRTGGQFECTTSVGLEVDPSDFYEVTATGSAAFGATSEGWEATTSVNAAETDEAIVLEVDGLGPG